jgi:hypothetical protein
MRTSFLCQILKDYLLCVRYARNHADLDREHQYTAGFIAGVSMGDIWDGSNTASRLQDLAANCSAYRRAELIKGAK